MRHFLFAPLALLLTSIWAGCVGESELGSSEASAREPSDGFHVPPLRVGDVFRYGFGFQTHEEGGFAFTGITEVAVVGRVSHADGLGRIREAVHVRQASPGTDFAEDYFVDAESLRQFQVRRSTTYNETSRFPREPFQPIPMRHASYGNGTGIETRNLEDPLFEDFNFFGAFASDVDLPVEGDFNITGHLWLRNTTFLIQNGTFTGRVEAPPDGLDAAWGPYRTVAFDVTADFFGTQEGTSWRGTFSERVPLAVEAVRRIQVKGPYADFSVEFNVTLLAYDPGDGPELFRVGKPPAMGRRAAEFAAWERMPVDGSGPKVPFTLAELRAALDQNQTAQTYFQKHPNAYLLVAHLDQSIDWEAASHQPGLPASHWYDWSGVFVDPSGWELHFDVTKFADANGNGPAAVVPVNVDYVFDTVFDALSGDLPGVPNPEDLHNVYMKKGTRQVPERSSLAPDALTLASAVRIFQSAGASGPDDLVPNVVVVSLPLLSGRYLYYMARQDWYFPENSFLTVFYDEGPLVLDRRTAFIDPSGLLLQGRDFQVEVKHT